MTVLRQNEVTPESIGEGRTRYLVHTNDLMMVVIDFVDGPASAPDPPHSHPHEQITYVAEGELLFFLDGEPHKLGPGNMITVASDVPHTIQLLSDKVRLVDTFSPIREEFLPAD
ncbi:MAG: cupin domain-containing protein [Anaerolineae bacterium]|nr:cupin domain-containing protein [Anaerolineae bacterium]